MKKLFPFQFIILVLAACSAKFKPTSQSGKLVNTFRVLEPSSNTYIIPNKHMDDTIMYRDSCVILPIFVKKTEEFNGVETKFDIHVSYYIFIDLRTESFYDYAPYFSDTASLLKSYKESELPFGKPLWFMVKKDEFTRFFDKQKLADTIIDKKKYKRFTYDTIYKRSDNEKEHMRYTAYLNCSEKMMFNYCNEFSKQQGCPATRVEQTFLSDFKPLKIKAMTTSKSEINYIADTLTLQENKVFDAWEKYAKEHPVK